MPQQLTVKDLLKKTPPPGPAIRAATPAERVADVARRAPVLRAATWRDRLQDVLQTVYEQAAKQPLGQAADALGMSDLMGMARSFREPPPEVMLSEAPGPPGEDEAKRAVAKAIRAYHGSPHDFEAFSTAKIGSGEGAQAYGHGLYFAENPAVAEDYRRSLAAPTADAPAFRLRGEPVASGTDRWRLAQLLETPKAGETPADMVTRRIAELEDHANFAAKVYGEDTAGMYRLHAKELRAINPEELTFHRPGKTYEVNIHADPATFLDYDKPISQQPPEIRAKVTAAMDSLQRAGKSPAEYHELIGTPHGSQALREAGIPGIKYLDQGSRAAGQGTNNYAVFDDALIEILKKYGLVLPLAGSAWAAQQPHLKGER